MQHFHDSAHIIETKIGRNQAPSEWRAANPADRELKTAQFFQNKKSVREIRNEKKKNDSAQREKREFADLANFVNEYD